MELYGSKYYRVAIDLPTRIASLVEGTPLRALYTAEHIINNHTLFPYFCAFAAEDLRSTVKKMMTHQSDGFSIKALLGISSSDRGDKLYYCPACTREDFLQFGEPYWHRVHRVPGMHFCPTHGLELLSNCPTCGHEYSAGRFGYVALSSYCPNGHALWQRSEVLPDSHSIKHMKAYAQDVVTLLNKSSHHEFAVLRDSFRERLKEMGLSTRSNTLRLTELANSFMRFYGDDFLEEMGASVKAASPDNWLFSAFRSRERAVSPLKVLLIARFLFGSYESCEENLGAQYMPFGTGPWPCDNKVAPHYRQETITTCELQRGRRAKEVIGVFRCECGFTYTRTSAPESSSTSGEKRSRVIEYGRLWLRALDELFYEKDLSITAIAERLGTTGTTVISQLEKMAKAMGAEDTHQDVESVNEIDRDAYRKSLLSLKESNTKLTRSGIKSTIRREFNWLYQNDREWFEDNLPPAVRPKHEAGWEPRDLALCTKIAEAVQQIKELPGKPLRITKNIIFRWLGMKDPYRTTSSDKLPRTKEMVKRLVESVEQYYERKVLFIAQQLSESNIPVTAHSVKKAAGISGKSTKLCSLAAKIIAEKWEMNECHII